MGNCDLVEILPRRGVRVAEFSKRDVEGGYFPRKHLVSIAAAKVICRLVESSGESVVRHLFSPSQG